MRRLEFFFGGDNVFLNWDSKLVFAAIKSIVHVHLLKLFLARSACTHM